MEAPWTGGEVKQVSASGASRIPPLPLIGVICSLR